MAGRLQEKMFEIYIVLSCLLLACSGEECPKCPSSTLPYCHQQIRFGDPCPCGICLTRCPNRSPVCKKGETCVLEDVYFGKDRVGKSAICKPFVTCPEIHCPVPCSASGYYVDLNGCTTCLCNDPCKEKCGDKPCYMWSVNPGTEPNVECSN